MPDGFTVRLGAISDFAETVAAIVHDYGLLTEQLNAADVAKVDPDFRRLLGVSNYAGSTEVNDAARAMLTKYGELFSGFVRAHAVIKAQMEFIHTALIDNHNVYAEHEARHEASFRALLTDLPTRDDHGTA
jgi:hypothetical protein